MELDTLVVDDILLDAKKDSRRLLATSEEVTRSHNVPLKKKKDISTQATKVHCTFTFIECDNKKHLYYDYY